MGSGKTHTLRWLWQMGYFPLHAFVQSDPDRVRGMLPELRGYLERCPEVHAAPQKSRETWGGYFCSIRAQRFFVDSLYIHIIAVRRFARGQDAGEMTHKEAGCVAEILAQAALNRGLSVIIDGSLQDVDWHVEYINVCPHLCTEADALCVAWHTPVPLAQQSCLTNFYVGPNTLCDTFRDCVSGTLGRRLPYSV